VSYSRRPAGVLEGRGRNFTGGIGDRPDEDRRTVRTPARCAL